MASSSHRIKRQFTLALKIDACIRPSIRRWHGVNIEILWLDSCTIKIVSEINGYEKTLCALKFTFLLIGQVSRFDEP